MSADLYAALAARLGPKGFTTDPSVIAPHLLEWRGRFQGATAFLAMPASTEEVADVVRLCAGARVSITPQGGNTGLVGGQIPQGEVLLSTRRMNRIRAIDPVDDSIVAEAGVVLTNVQRAARDADRLFPLSLGSEGAATIGGLVSTNAGGVHVIRYGMMRDLVLGLEAVLPDGTLLSALNTLRKDNTGYDLKQLFIGAEGTLGIVTAASLRLFPRPRQHIVAFASVPHPEAALNLLHRAKSQTGSLSAFEVMNRLSVALAAKHVPNIRDPMPQAALMALLEFESTASEGLRDAVEGVLSAAMETGEALDVLIAENEGQARAFWAVRESIAAGHRPEGAQSSHDVSVPVSKTAQFLAKADQAIAAIHAQARIVSFGHMGDGNFHYTLLQAEGADPALFPREALSSAVHETAHAFGGSISAEHGIGVARLDDFTRFKRPEAIALMRAVKSAIDPNGVMNPRALIP